MVGNVPQKNYVCKVLIRKFPSNLRSSERSGAQSHHAGFQMAMKYGSKPEVQAYAKSVCSKTGTQADNFGTTLTLMQTRPSFDGGEATIRNIISLAQVLGVVADVVVDPSYPLGGSFSAEALTAGYILMADDDPRWNILIPRGDWDLYNPD